MTILVGGEYAAAIKAFSRCVGIVFSFLYPFVLEFSSLLFFVLFCVLCIVLDYYLLPTTSQMGMRGEERGHLPLLFPVRKHT